MYRIQRWSNWVKSPITVCIDRGAAEADDDSCSNGHHIYGRVGPARTDQGGRRIIGKTWDGLLEIPVTASTKSLSLDVDDTFDPRKIGATFNDDSRGNRRRADIAKAILDGGSKVIGSVGEGRGLAADPPNTARTGRGAGVDGVAVTYDDG